MSVGIDTHDPSGPTGHLPGYAGEEMRTSGSDPGPGGS
jgi:hypothetical protein